MLLFVVSGNWKVCHCGISSVIILMPNFVEIHEVGQNVRTHRHAHKEHGDFIHLLVFLRKEKHVKIVHTAALGTELLDLTGPSSFPKPHIISSSWVVHRALKFVHKYVFLIKS
jgi:hypothetical protein